MKKTFVLSFLLTICIHANCQLNRTIADNENTWLTYTGTHKVSEKWGVHLEAQLRRNQLLLKPQQLLLRAGINYYINASVSVTAGYCYVSTSPYGVFPVKTTFPENRLWQQLQIKNQLGSIEMISRFRMEERYVNSPVADGTNYKPGPAVYSNRIRLLTRFSVPLKGKEIADKSFYLTAYDEVFISFGKNVAYNLFDQNRACLALGYKIPKAGRLEAGYLNQLIVKSDGLKIENNHTLLVALISNISFRKPKKV